MHRLAASRVVIDRPAQIGGVRARRAACWPVMLLVRVVDTARDRAAVLAFVLGDDGQVGMLWGDASLLDFDRPVACSDCGIVTRVDPVRWAQALGEQLRRHTTYDALVGVVGASQRSPVLPSPRRSRGRGPRSMLAVLLAVGAGAIGGSWAAAAHPSAAGPAWFPTFTVPAVTPSSPPARSSAVMAPAPVVSPVARSRLARTARSAAQELAGSGDRAAVGWDAASGLWDLQVDTAGGQAGYRLPMWWQSGLALRSLVRYLTVTHNTLPAYQRLLDAVYRLNISRPGTLQPSMFVNKFMDDTAWWGLAWAAASQYELTVRQDFADAARFLTVAEADARYIAAQPRRCGGVEFEVRYAPNTVTDAEFVALTARLAAIRARSGPLFDGTNAKMWLADAREAWSWLAHSGLVNLARGSVHAEDSGNCHPTGVGLTYMQGEVADALVQMGMATSQTAYFKQAARFIDRALSPMSGMLAGGVLQESCEAQRKLCASKSYNLTAYKGLLDDAVADWTAATGSTAYDPFLVRQADAVVSNSASDGRTASACGSARACQLGFYWSRRVPAAAAQIPANAGSQASGLSALTNALSPGG